MYAVNTVKQKNPSSPCTRGSKLLIKMDSRVRGNGGVAIDGVAVDGTTRDAEGDIRGLRNGR